MSLRVIRQYERGVAFFLGRFWGTKGPGLIFLPAGFAAQKRVSLRIVALDIPPQDVITRDNVSVKVNAVLYMRVTDPAKAIIEIEDYLYATSQLAQTTLRSVLGEVELDELLSDREKINAVLKKIIDERTDPWGIEVSAVEVKDVDLPDQMKRAMARQAEAERERRAKVIAAQGELQASETLAQAARTLAHRAQRHPAPLPPDGHRDRRGEQLDDDLPDPDRAVHALPAGASSVSRRARPRCPAPVTEGGAARYRAPRRRPVRPDVPAPPRRGPDARAGLAWATAPRPGSIGPRSSGSSSGPPSCRPPTATSAEELTPEQVLALGREVGIPGRYLQQALLEERTRVVAVRPAGSVGPDRGARRRSWPSARCPGTAAGVEAALTEWMEEKELFCVQRRQPGRITWEPLGGVAAAVRRSTAAFSRGSAAMMLSPGRHRVRHHRWRSRPGWCHVMLTAEARKARAEFVGGGAALAGRGRGRCGPDGGPRRVAAGGPVSGAASALGIGYGGGAPVSARRSPASSSASSARWTSWSMAPPP